MFLFRISLLLQLKQIAESFGLSQIGRKIIIMADILRKIGNIPVSSVTIGTMYPGLSQKNEKLRSLERSKEIVRLKRGLYVVSPEVTGKPLSTELMANHIYAPSYVSMSTALRYYGLISEAVYAVQSMTIKHSRVFNTPYGSFYYHAMSSEAFHIGVRLANEGDYTFLIASPEKALCDLIANTSRLDLRYQREAREYLEEDIRLDMDAFANMKASIFREYAAVGKKGNSIRTILKLLEKLPG